MITDIRGVNTHNKGAHLMLSSITRQLPDKTTKATSPNGATYADRAALGLRQTFVLDQAARLTGVTGSLIPERLADMFGLARMKDISGVLDASGFAYSDSFGALRARREASLVPLWRRNGTVRIFLPQAFGPFVDDDTARYSRELLKDADLIYARDQISLNHLDRLGIDASIVRICPDFTVLETGINCRESPQEPAGIFVPNSKLITHGGQSEREYIASAQRVLRTFTDMGLRSVVAPHESTDVRLAHLIVDGTEADTFWAANPLEIKGFLAAAEVVVGSRFHALVGALSSGRPTVGLGWSHKYDELFADYGVPQWVASNGEDLSEFVRYVIQDQAGLEQVRRRGAEIKGQVSEMWRQVNETLGSAV
ncbi:polysaccharide pyruvyl transferase family protein [Rhodococcus sp. NBC_00294]|uniref:polysaccharide pyruvyl transferase family protein n=1 Tax=Rhodococcus sp. NBC_00294 TaxID=2976004 RepID=UPI002E2963D2|nr:polysaccharide pyruvyl transferase family protein [Rhodococcus sp. NBC_00294]